MKTVITTPAISGPDLMADTKFFSAYSRWMEQELRYETWNESVERVMLMHRTKYAAKMNGKLKKLLAEAEAAYKAKLVLGAQRALQFGGDQLLKHEAKMYNCSSSYADRPDFFQEAMYLLLCGCGVGFSVQKRHVKHIPLIRERGTEVKVFTVPDSIEGWASAFGVLLSSYFVSNQPFPEYAGYKVVFDFSAIRPRGSLISGGFKAPGPDGLQTALTRCEALLETALREQTMVSYIKEFGLAEGDAAWPSGMTEKLMGYIETAATGMGHSEVPAGHAVMRPVVVYDFSMHMADAVLSGGVRRSATICLFDKDDVEMLMAKTGNWFATNPQRARSNNSVIIKRDELTRSEWAYIMMMVREFGEPGFVFVDDLDFTVNPCVEIGMFPQTDDGVSGFQFCNLVETNGALMSTAEIFYRACRAAAILGTFQAGYTNFKFLSEATRKITEKESLLGVSITGWMNNPEVLFDDEILRKGAEIVKKTNRTVAKLLGINPAARTTCAKPSGNASVLLKTASGIHGEHAPMYIRNVQLNKDDDVAQLIMRLNPHMVEEKVGDLSGRDIVVGFPIIAKEGSIFKRDLLGVKQLEYVKKAQLVWVEAGTNVELCTRPTLRHNISNTISVDNWAEVEQYLFDNRGSFAGVSLMAAAGDKAYAQAPFTEVFTAVDLAKTYGDASMFASGLIVDGLAAFSNNLWSATDTALGFGMDLSDGREDLLRRDWVRRFVKFADNHFNGDLQRTSFCLKDCYNLHRWSSITKNLVAIDFEKELLARSYLDADTLASQACAGGICEIF